MHLLLSLGYENLARIGQLKDVKQFDYNLFGISKEKAASMLPESRHMVECIYEALIDAGK